MTEYWLQKKSLGGWSIVTWYSDLDQAKLNYNRCIQNGMSGYSWRLCAVEAIEVSMLEEVTEIEAPEVNLPIPNDKPLKVNSWGKTIVAPKSSWGDTNPWNRHSANPDIAEANKPEHGLSGSVWVINHLTRQKLRVSASELQKHLDNGFERGGPRTVFREG